MSQELGVFVTPLLLLPGVALLVMSTSARYGQLHGEVHHLEGHHHALERGRHLLRRGRLFKHGLVSLYVAASFLALASFAGGILKLADRDPNSAILLLTFAGVACLLFAVLQLVRESHLSLEILESHVHDLEEGSGGS